MDRIKTMIQRRRVKHVNVMENNPHGHFLEALIGSFLYSKSSNDIIQLINVPHHLDELSTKDQSFWNSLLQKYILQEPHVCIEAIPSPELAEQSEQEEKKRIEQRKTQIGSEGLQELNQLLKRNQDLNNVPIPDSILTRFPIPDVTKIEFFKTFTCTNHHHQDSNHDSKLSNHTKCNSSRLPFLIQFNHFDSQFVKIQILADSHHLTARQKLYLPLFTECMFKVPLQRPNQQETSYKQVLQMLDEHVIEYFNCIGYLNGGRYSAGDYSQFIKTSIKVESQKYEMGVRMMSDFLFHTKFTKKRVKMAAQNLMNGISSTKRDAEYIASEALNVINFEKNGNYQSCTCFVQESFLAQVIKNLDSDQDDGDDDGDDDDDQDCDDDDGDDSNLVIRELIELRSALMRPERFMVHVTSDAYSHSDPIQPWYDFVKSHSNQDHAATTITTPTIQRYLVDHVRSNNISFGIKSTDSGYLYQTCKGLSGFDDSDHAALAVLIEYLTGFEGPFWTAIRGKGLSYNFNMSSNRGQGLLYFDLTDSGDVVNAYAEADRIVKSYQNQDLKFDQIMLEASISGAIYALISSEQTKSMSAGMQFVFMMQGVGNDYHQKKLLSKIAAVTQQDVIRVLHKYVVKLFDPEQCNTVLVTNASKVKKVSEQLGLVSNKVIKISNVNQFFAK
ncbi:hypothetical protein AKO1_006320 [Acrasis kona]|uniref:Peptidase M16C associated domain-containing protein n=1 Tax=Acrasis kona TaxID=1008807 RepID=A0AAW2YGV8_9EUKA